MLIGGIHEVNAKDWQRHTCYYGMYVCIYLSIYPSLSRFMYVFSSPLYPSTSIFPHRVEPLSLTNVTTATSMHNDAILIFF